MVALQVSMIPLEIGHHIVNMDIYQQCFVVPLNNLSIIRTNKPQNVQPILYFYVNAILTLMLLVAN